MGVEAEEFLQSQHGQHGFLRSMDKSGYVPIGDRPRAAWSGDSPPCSCHLTRPTPRSARPDGAKAASPRLVAANPVVDANWECSIKFVKFLVSSLHAGHHPIESLTLELTEVQKLNLICHTLVRTSGKPLAPLPSTLSNEPSCSYLRRRSLWTRPVRAVWEAEPNQR